MNAAETLLLQQMQQMAASFSLPRTGGSKDQSTSFQDMMEQAGKDTGAVEKEATETGSQSKKEPVQEKPEETAPVQEEQKDQETEKPQELHGDSNAMVYMMDLFRPEIVEAAEAEVLPETAPVELAAEAGEAIVPTAEAPEEAAPQAAAETAEIAEKPAEEAAPQELSRQESAEQTDRPAAETAEAPQQEVQRETVQREEAPVLRDETAEEAPEETKGEAAELNQPVFRNVEDTPVKVGEAQKPVDTQKPDMDEKLAAAIRQAAEDGAQRLEIKLSPANLGSITIEMTRDAGGALQVVLHAATGRAESLLTQHLDGLHAALQNYGQGQQVHVEVQRGQESQEQHMFQQADPDGRGQQHHERRQKQEEQPERSEDFLQRLRLGLISLDEAG